MPPPPTRPPSERYLLGTDLSLDVGRQRVERNAVEIALPKLSFDFLLALARAAPNVVNYDDLMSQVWPGLIVQSETITQRAKLLRDALGNDGHASKLIRGVRGRGYVLDCTVQRCEITDLAADPVPSPNAIGTASPATHTSVATLRPVFRRPAVVMTVALLAIGATAATVALIREGAFGNAAPHVITVAPFQALTADPRDAALAQGVGEAVRTRLNAPPDLPAADKELQLPIDRLLTQTFSRADAQYVLKGAVQRGEERLRITVQLVDTRSGELIHSFIAEADARDLLRLEDDIARRVARALRVDSEARAAARYPDPGARNAEARLAFERGRARYQRWRMDDGETAIVHFKRSIALDPSYARAYAWQAMAEVRNAVTYKREDSLMAMQRVQPLFERAFALDPSLGEAHAIRAFHDLSEGPVVSEAGIRKGLALEPDSAESYSLLAQRVTSSDFGRDRTREGLEAIDRAIALSPETTRYRYLKALFLRGDPATAKQAVDLAQSLLESDADFAPAAARLARWRLASSQSADSVRWSERAIALDPETSWLRAELCFTYLDLADPAAARDVIDAAEPGAVVHCRAALALYEGDWRRAAQLVFSMPPAVIASCDDAVGLFGALSRYARETGDSDRVWTCCVRPTASDSTT